MPAKNYISNISDATKARISFLIKILFSASVVWYVVAKIDFIRIWENLQNASAPLILLALALMPANIFLQQEKWALISRKLFGETNRKKLFKSLMLGISSAMITPLQTGVYLGRASVFEKEKAGKVVFATFFDKLITLFITAFFGSLATLYFISEKYGAVNFLTVPVLFLIVFAGIFLFVIFTNDGIDKANLFKAFLPKKIFAKWETKLQFINNIDKQLFLQAFMFSVIQKILILFQFSILIFAFGGKLNILNALVAALLVFFSKSFFPPISLGDIGVREAMAIFFFGFFGVAEQTAFNAAMFLFIINLLLPSLFSLKYLAR